MVVLITGGRTFADFVTLDQTLTRLHAQYKFTLLIEGGANGADALGRRWANVVGIPNQTFPADWGKYKGMAGSMRNARMLREGNPDIVVALPGGTGTSDMVRKAYAAMNVLVFDLRNSLGALPKL